MSTATPAIRRPLRAPLISPRRRLGRPWNLPAGDGPRRQLRWWREGLLVVALYAGYDVTRGLQRGSVGAADANGRRWLHGEQLVHLAPEHLLNNALGQLPVLAVLAGYFYATLHFLVTPAVLIWLYRSHPDRYRPARTALLLTTGTALLGFWLLPTTPPRLLPGGHYLDTLANVSAWGWWGSEGSTPRGLGTLSNQLAAMPSLHVGWALWCGLLIARYAIRREVRALGALYPVITTLVVLATANHYLFDAVAGAAVTGFALAAVAGRRASTAPVLVSGRCSPVSVG